MSYQKTAKTSYGQRLSGSLKGTVMGLAMFILGTIVLFWIEGQFVKTRKSLHEAESIVVRVDDVSKVDPSLNGQLIHATAFADTDETLTDRQFGVSEKAIAISREVAYYQIEETSSVRTENRTGGGQERITTYSYEKKWVKAPINSAVFENPAYRKSNFTLTTVENKTERAKNVSFGGYALPPFIISSISGSAPATVNLNADEIAQWEKTFPPDNTAAQRVHVKDNRVYFGKSATTPEIGDVRITLTKTVPADISIIAGVAGSTFEPYISSSGKAVSEVAMGTVSAEKMFAGAHSSNMIITWFFRIIGIFLVIGGLKAMFNILPTLFQVLPFLGNIVDAGVGLVCWVFGGAWSLIIMSVAWLFYRPMVGIPLLLAAFAGIWFLKKKSEKK